MVGTYGINRPVDYLIRNPTFLKEVREAIFPNPDESNRRRLCSRTERFLERAYHIRLPALGEVASLRECIELIRGRNAFARCLEPMISAILTAQRQRRGVRPRLRRCDPSAVRDVSDESLLEEGRYITLRIDLRVPREQVLTHVGVCYDVFSEVAGGRTFRRNRKSGIDDLAVWDEYMHVQSFTRIARAHRWRVSAVRKAYYRAFVRIMGEPYDPHKHNRKRLSREQIRRSCEICADNPSRGGHCRSLCPSAKAYVDQDKRSSPFVSSRAESISSLEYHSPARAYERRRFLGLISLIAGKTFDSIEEALDDLEDRDLERLRNDPRLRAECL